MPRFTDLSTGATVSVSDDEAADLDPGNYVPIKAEPRRRARRKPKPTRAAVEADLEDTDLDDNKE